MACFEASTARSLVHVPGSAILLSLIPVLVVIHSSLTFSAAFCTSLTRCQTRSSIAVTFEMSIVSISCISRDERRRPEWRHLGV